MDRGSSAVVFSLKELSGSLGAFFPSRRESYVAASSPGGLVFVVQDKPVHE